MKKSIHKINNASVKRDSIKLMITILASVTLFYHFPVLNASPNVRKDKALKMANAKSRKPEIGILKETTPA